MGPKPSLKRKKAQAPHRCSNTTLDELRVRQAKSMLKHGKSLRKIAKELKCHHSVIGAIKNRGNLTNFDKKKIAKREANLAAKKTRNAHVKTIALAKVPRGYSRKMRAVKAPTYTDVADAYNEFIAIPGGLPKVTRKLVSQICRETGVVRKKRKKAPRECCVDEGKKSRVKFAKRELRKPVNEIRKKYCFSDEKLLKCVRVHQKYELVLKGTRAQEIPTVKWATQVMIWGVIGRGFRYMHMCDPMEKVDAQKYQQILNKVKKHFKGTNFVLMQDGATPHTCPSTMEWLNKNGFVVVKGWPADSPDLNPIETLWDHFTKALSKKIEADIQYKGKGMKKNNLDLLYHWAPIVWKELPDSLIDKLLDSYPERLNRCIEREGAYAM